MSKNTTTNFYNSRVETEVTYKPKNNSTHVKFSQKDKAGLLIFAGTPETYAKKGGTKIYCPSCEDIRVCSATTPHFQDGNSQNWYRTDHDDIHWFKRGRMCRTCFYHFNTAEIEIDFIEELVALRDDILKGKIITAEDLSNYGSNVVSFPLRD